MQRYLYDLQGYLVVKDVLSPAVTAGLNALLDACQKNYNDWLHDYASASNGRLFGLAAIPLQDPQAAATELVRVIKKGFRGGCIPCTASADRE